MSKKYLNTRAVCTRYGNVSDRTIDRWVATGDLPPPIYIQRQRYWDQDVLDARDKARRATPGPITPGSGADRQRDSAGAGEKAA
jgi:hypothetical protein